MGFYTFLCLIVSGEVIIPDIFTGLYTTVIGVIGVIGIID